MVGMELPPYKADVNYFQEFWKLYLQNELLISQLEQCSKERNEILQKVIKIEVNLLLAHI